MIVTDGGGCDDDSDRMVGRFAPCILWVTFDYC